MPLLYPLLLGGILALSWLSIWSLPLLLFVPMIWTAAPSRLRAACFILSYYLFSTWGLHRGIVRFHPEISLFFSLFLCILYAAFLTIPWAILWPTSKSTPLNLCIRTTALLLAITCPPLGLFHWANPLFAAGVFFPGLSIWGLCLTLILMISFALISRNHSRIHYAFLGIIFLFSAVSNGRYTVPPSPRGWKGVDTSLGVISAEFTNDYQRQAELFGEVRRELQSGARVVVLPENIVGWWTPSKERLWLREFSRELDLGVSILFGAEQRIDEFRYQKGVVHLGRKFIRAGIPMPFSEWRPFAAERAQPNFHRLHLTRVDSRRVLLLVCFEGAILWPSSKAIRSDPESILFVSNLWWAEGTTLMQRMKVATSSTTRLLGASAISASNN